MSTDRIKGEIVFICDGCDETLETGTDDFREANMQRVDDNWVASKYGDAWKHFCPGCKS